MTEVNCSSGRLPRSCLRVQDGFFKGAGAGERRDGPYRTGSELSAVQSICFFGKVSFSKDAFSHQPDPIPVYSEYSSRKPDFNIFEAMFPSVTLDSSEHFSSRSFSFCSPVRIGSLLEQLETECAVAPYDVQREFSINHEEPPRNGIFAAT